MIYFLRTCFPLFIDAFVMDVALGSLSSSHIGPPRKLVGEVARAGGAPFLVTNVDSNRSCSFRVDRVSLLEKRRGSTNRAREWQESCRSRLATETNQQTCRKGFADTFRSIFSLVRLSLTSDLTSMGLDWTWTCQVCGKPHGEGERARKCVTCGRERHVRSPKISALSAQFRSCDPRDERLRRAAPSDEEATKAPRVRWGGVEGRQALVLFHRSEYEAIDRTALKDDTIRVLASVKEALETCKT